VWLDVTTEEQQKRIDEMEERIADELIRAENEAHAQGELPIESKDAPPPRRKRRRQKTTKVGTPTPPPTSAVKEKKRGKKAKATTKQPKLPGVG
jgi:hypothetical protein